MYSEPSAWYDQDDYGSSPLFRSRLLNYKAVREYLTCEVTGRETDKRSFKRLSHDLIDAESNGISRRGVSSV